MSQLNDSADSRLKRLRFRAWHRGLREVDLIMGPFADACIGQLDAVELDHFETLLTAADNDLYDWFTGRSAPSDRFDRSLIERIRAHAHQRPTS